MRNRKLRTLLFGIFTFIAAAVCVRLGIWQLDRLEQRRSRNAAVRSKALLPAATIEELRGRDSASIHWRHVRVRGVADPQRELILAGRSQAGAPGVQLLTPIRPLDATFGDTLILVLRGFVYAADGRTFDNRAAWEGDTLDVDGIVTMFPPSRNSTVRLPSTPRAIRALDRDTIEAILGSPIEPYLLLAMGDTVPADIKRPARVPPPSLSEGPHQSYALQWFGFALVFVVGFGAFVFSQRKPER